MCASNASERSTGGAPDALIGRHAEWARSERFFELLESGPATLIIEGEPGIGKTTLWNAILAATAATTCILVSRPAETETDLAFAALTDLLGPVADELGPMLPSPQRRALDIALMRREVALVGMPWHRVTDCLARIRHGRRPPNLGAGAAGAWRIRPHLRLRSGLHVE